MPAKVQGNDVSLFAALAYASNFFAPLIGPLLIYLIKKEERLVRFHAIQSIALSVVVFAGSMVLGVVIVVLTFVTLGLAAIVTLPLMLLAVLGIFLLNVFLAVKAYNGEYFKLPLIGSFAEKHS